MITILPGYPSPLGSTFDGEGTNFALFSANATRVELCLYDTQGINEIARIDLPEKTQDIWHGYLPDVAPGHCYGYRVYGPYEPTSGHRFNHHKLLLDPYARQLKGEFQWHESHFGYVKGDGREDLSFDTRDNAEWMPKAVVLRGSSQLARSGSRHITPWQDTVIYETHVRGFTQLHPDVPASLRGTFAGLTQSKVIEYIKALGVTTIELMPIHGHCDEYFLHERGLTNYWGYNTLSFFSPHQAYLSGESIAEFREMVDRFHDADLEVILDVVYNHTCEGNHLGPTLSLRGIDNASYYHLMPGDNRHYVNDSGCGNTLNLRHPRVAQLVMDSLRYWAGEMCVDGFRFDLATVLGRQQQGFSNRATLFQMIAQDPILSSKKMIAEPWDLGPGGYQLGCFPSDWSEWNDRYRDTVRRFWRGDKGLVPELARRLHGSGDLFESSGRTPWATINYLTSHDGFTLRDLVSYSSRHNEANLEQNNDGHRENHGCNHGVEGESSNGAILSRRRKQQRNFIATLCLSQGVPMLLAGDELNRTQRGNNNAYCQDNEINWIDWSDAAGDDNQLLTFTRRLLKLRRLFPLLRANHYRHEPGESRVDSIQWLNGDGKPMREEHWHESHNQLLGYLMAEENPASIDGKQHLLVILNAHNEHKIFTLPDCGYGGWHLLIDTSIDSNQTPSLIKSPGGRLEIVVLSMQIWMAGEIPVELKSEVLC